MRMLNAHAEKVVEEFKMSPTKPPKGAKQKGIRFTLRVLAYANGKVDLIDDNNSQTHEMFALSAHPEHVFMALCARASRLAGESEQEDKQP